MWWVAVLVIIRWNSCDSAGFIPCHSNWIKVLQTDETGNEETGSKNALIEAILHGAQLQVFVPDWNYASSTQMTMVIKNTTELCVQAIFHISKDSWDSFRSDAYWYFLYLCTNGRINKARWYVGKHEQPSTVDSSAQTSSRLRILWFVRYIHGYGTEVAGPIFCNSDHGNKTCGSLDNLAAVAKMGAQIRANAMSKGPDFNSVGMPFNTIFFAPNESQSGVGILGQYIWSVSFEDDDMGMLKFQKNATWYAFVLATDGSFKLAIWNIGTNDTSEIVRENHLMDWFADTCWMLAYKHNENGKPVDGSLDFLRDSIRNGHRVRIVVETLGTSRFGMSFEADNLVLTHDVSAQILNTILEDFKWHLIHFSSSGEGENIGYNLGLITKNGTFNYTAPASWFIDTRAWTHVLSTSKFGIVTFGSKSDLITHVKRGFMLRCVIKFNQTHILAAQADNVEFSPDGTNLGAQLLRIVSYKIVGNSNRHFEKVPHWQFTIATTQGLIRQSEWIIGEHKTRNTNPLTADIDWFVN